jgi:hypothetical protein
VCQAAVATGHTAKLLGIVESNGYGLTTVHTRDNFRVTLKITETCTKEHLRYNSAWLFEIPYPHTVARSLAVCTEWMFSVHK